MTKLPKEFKRLSEIDNNFKQRLYFVGILTKYLKVKKIRPIVVGGHAVEFYTLGSYTTGDIDIVSEGQAEIESI
ncbi:MAG: UbiD family decarboxylase, partial [Candidatus Omnitrophica bacterium]|nr:UbiD family decarboxylase [Candidatus Omnitrophota bacterium]